MSLQDKITINLLPIELTLSKRERERRNLTNSLSIAILVIIVITTAIVLSIRLSQTIRLRTLNSQIDGSKNSIQNYKEREGLLTILKTRLDGINAISQSDPVQAQAFNLILTIMPEDIKIIEFKADKSGIVTLSGQTGNLFSLKSFFNNLMDTKLNQGKISGVKIDSLSQRNENELRFDLSMQISGGKK